MESRCEIDIYGDKFYYNSRGYYHRENNLPAVEKVNGDIWYYINGKHHREDGPAITMSGNEYWYLDDIEYIIPTDMPMNLFLAYVKWKYKNGYR